MTELPHAELPTPAATPGRWLAAAEIALVFLVLFLHGSWPVPDVNEAHYLSKAKHYWDPTWCASDFFCQTADAHKVFYWTFGWLTLWQPLARVAWIGRLITWAALAWSWRRLSWAIVPRPWVAVLSAALVVCLNENAHMAGEWFVGGIEAKGFAYILIFLGLEAIVRGRWNRAWLMLGAASSFHVLVGGWSAVAAAIAWLATPSDRPALRSMLPGLVGGLLLALPGLWPAMALTASSDPQIIQEANSIYVYERLPHHLVADRFKEGFVARHLLLWAVWLLVITIVPASRGELRLRWCVAGAMLFALLGFALSYWANFAPLAAAGLLRFYWFRLSDVFVPLGAALAGVSFISWLGHVSIRASRAWLFIVMAVVAYDLAGQAGHLPWDAISPTATVVVPRVDKTTVYDDWLDVCRWVNEHTRPDDRFFTPRLAGTFKWYAGRGEVVNWKDIPQDAAGIVEWWRRMNEIHGRRSADPRLRWHESLAELGDQRLRELADKYEAPYAVVALVPEGAQLEMAPLYENHSYAVYRLRVTEDRTEAFASKQEMQVSGSRGQQQD